MKNKTGAESWNILKSELVEAITMDSWCILCMETVGADTYWPVLGNTL